MKTIFHLLDQNKISSIKKTQFELFYSGFKTKIEGWSYTDKVYYKQLDDFIRLLAYQNGDFQILSRFYTRGFANIKTTDKVIFHKNTRYLLQKALR